MKKFVEIAIHSELMTTKTTFTTEALLNWLFPSYERKYGVVCLFLSSVSIKLDCV